MFEVLSLADYRQRRCVSFDRSEFERILAVYSRGVATGAWKDYALDQGPSMAAFSMLRHAEDPPLFIVTKLPPGSHRLGDYVVSQGWRRLKRGRTVDEVLSVFDDPMEPASPAN